MSAPSPVSARNFADRFELKSQAGSGGMGTVYQALDRSTGEMVAVKILHGKGVTDVARFDLEARLLSELRHGGIVRYVDHGMTANGESYIAMEWLSGETLEERLIRGPLPAGAAARLAQRVLEALAAAHERGIVHRDVKPSNVFLVDWRLDETRILDFGIARRVFDPKRFTKVGATVGTPMYAAPEQARGDRDVDARADIFSLGCVLFECLAGEPPFTGESPMEVMAKICIGAPPRLRDKVPDVSPELEALVDSLLTQDRGKRPADAAALARQFAALAGELRDEVRPLRAGGRNTLSDGEQRVMTALMMVSRDAAIESTRMPPKRAFPWEGSTSVLVPTPPRLDDTQEIARTVEPFGGHVDRLLDRSLLVTLPGQGLLREQAVQIARCALALRERFPDAVYAVATGRAALLAKLPVGPLVDRAAALVEGQAMGEVHVDAATARLLPARFAVEGTGDRRVLRAELASDDRPRQVRGKTGPFVGRDRELATLTSLYAECADEEVARAALVLAGTGAGKTRLRQEFLRALAAAGSEPPLVLRASGELVRSSARYPLLQRVLASAGIDLDYARPTAQIQEAFVAWLRARCAERPVLLVLEDLQWADLACVQLVDAALRLLRDQPLFVLGLGRPEVDEQFPSLWSERSVERLRLPALGRRSGERLFRHYAPEANAEAEAFVLDRWEGNPFHLEELVEAVLSDRPVAPETVLGLVEARFDALPPEVRRVLRAASAFGDEAIAPEAIVALLGERSRRELDEAIDLLVSADLMQRCSSADATLRFRSRLLREAAYRTLPPGDRALARRLARSWLEHAGKTLPEFLVLPVSQSSAALAAS